MGINLYLCFMKKITEIPLRIFLYVTYFLIKVTKVEDIILYSLIRDEIKDEEKTEYFYNLIYGRASIKKEEVITPVNKEKSKKQELIDSINYLKNKSVKTKQDKESIYTLEMVLKNIK